MTIKSGIPMKTLETTAVSIDLSYLRLVTDGDEEFMKEMMASLVSDIDQRMKALATEVLAGNRKAIHLEAHSLKNLFAMLGVPPLNEFFAGLEANAHTTDLAPLGRQLALAEAQIDEIKKQIPGELLIAKPA